MEHDQVFPEFRTGVHCRGKRSAPCIPFKNLRLQRFKKPFGKIETSQMAMARIAGMVGVDNSRFDQADTSRFQDVTASFHGKMFPGFGVEPEDIPFVKVV